MTIPARVEVPFTHLLALNPGGQSLVRVDVSDGSVTELVGGLSAFPDGIVVDRRRQLVYWTNMGAPTLPAGRAPLQESDLDFYARNGSIERAALDGSGRTWLLREGSFVTGKQLAAAWSRGRLYWADREGAAVRSAALDGTGMRDEVRTAGTDTERRVARNQCVGIAVDEQRGHLYWTQKGPSDGGDGRILRTRLDIPPQARADGREVEVLWAGLPEPIDLEIDSGAGLLYWTDRGAPPSGNTLNRAELPDEGQVGGAVDIVSSGFREAIGLAVDFGAGIAYVSDLYGDIRAVPLGKGSERVVTQVAGGLTGLAGVHAA
ncbi:hypothetical protein AB0K11_13855 [Mycobacterium sp. NPDC050551]|uniref:hypothetical protein n=1 Tax=Mycobacterium sp. NPDC050551 TaxID=3155407 RepID=UPI00341E644C